MIRIAIRWDMRLTDREILRVVSQLKQPASFDEIAALADCSRTTVYNAMKRLSRKGIVTMIRETGRRYPAEYKINLENVPDEVRNELQ